MLTVYEQFPEWWEVEGSAITPADGADMESHAKEVAARAWVASRQAEGKE